MLLMHNPGSALLGAAVVLCGLPVRWLLTRRAELARSVANQFRLNVIFVFHCNTDN